MSAVYDGTIEGEFYTHKVAIPPYSDIELSLQEFTSVKQELKCPNSRHPAY